MMLKNYYFRSLCGFLGRASRYCIILLLIGMVPFIAFAQEQGEEIVTGKKYQIHSDILGEDREYWVYLPSSYSDTTLVESYPVLYLLDGDWYFSLATGIIEYSKGAFKLPEMIVVGILNKDRIRDFTPTKADTDMFGTQIQGLEMSGGADAFLQFMEKELVPAIETKYKTTDYRILLGHSFAGLLAAHAFMEDHPLFTAYLLIDPSMWWDKALLANAAKDYFKKGQTRQRSLYFAQADQHQNQSNPTGPHYDAMAAFLAEAEANKGPQLRYKAQTFTGETHASLGVLGLYQGLSFLFEGHRPPDSTFSSAVLIEAHYEKLSQKWGGRFIPPESLVRNLGFGAQYGEKNYEKAITFFELNLRNYPKSADGYRLLGEVYEMKGVPAKAKECFRKSLELNPNNEALRKKLEE